jgi:hypothetical protein
VASANGGSMVNATMRSAIAVSSLGMRDGCVLSWSSPSKPSAAKRSCQRQTQVGLARLAHDCVRAEPFGAQQHDPGAPDMRLCGVPVAGQDAKPIKIAGSDGKGDARSHPRDSHLASPAGIPIKIQMSGSIH